jgi:hypothetical protein
LLGRDRMKKGLVAILLCIVVASATVAYLAFRNPSFLKVGTFYYVWYGALPSDWTPPKFADYPVSILGNYSSANATVIKQQLIWIQDLGINFVVISWWGNASDSYHQFINNNTRKVFQVAEDNTINLKFAIMVEPFNTSGTSYNYVEIYDCVYNEFVLPYSSIYYNDSRPVLCFFNDDTLTDNGNFQQDSRFKIILVGQTNYVQWEYLNLNYYVQPKRHPYTDEISVTPRFDDHRYRTPSCVVDPNLTEGVYDEEWKNAMQLWRDGKINTIMITSWNEYVERTEIEPHRDATAHIQDPYFLYKKTKDYIKQIHQH